MITSLRRKKAAATIKIAKPLSPGKSEKFCRGCQKTLAASAFYISKRLLSSRCKGCTAERDKRPHQYGPFLPADLKPCFRCESVKPRSAFYIYLTTGRASAYCRPCHRDYGIETRSPEVCRRASTKRRARKAAAEGTFEAEDIIDILRMQKRRCAYCPRKLRGNQYEIDHITPLSRGGRNDRRNLQATCTTCNRRKQANDPLVFARSIGRLL